MEVDNPAPTEAISEAASINQAQPEAKAETAKQASVEVERSEPPKAFPEVSALAESCTVVSLSRDIIEKVFDLSSWLFTWQPNKQARCGKFCLTESGTGAAIAMAEIQECQVIKNFSNLRGTGAFNRADSSQKSAWRNRSVFQFGVCFCNQD